jgi:hypothetical protein
MSEIRSQSTLSSDIVENMSVASVALLFHVLGGLDQSAIWRRWESFKGSDRFRVFVHAKEGVIKFRNDFLYERTTAKVIPTSWRKTQRAKNELLRIALEDRHIDTFIHVSATCIPLQYPQDTLERLRDYQAGRSCSFVDCDDGSWGTRLRRAVAAKRNDEIRPGQIRKHSEWVVLCREHAQLIVDSETGPLQRFLIEESAAVDNEVVPGSVICHAGRVEEIVNRSLTFADWSEARGSPRSWLDLEKPESLRAIVEARQRDFLFARRFPSESNVKNYIEAIWATSRV